MSSSRTEEVKIDALETDMPEADLSRTDIQIGLQNVIDKLEPHKLESLQLNLEKGHRGLYYTSVNFSSDDIELCIGDEPIQHLTLCLQKYSKFEEQKEITIETARGNYLILLMNGKYSTWHLPEKSFSKTSDWSKALFVFQQTLELGFSSITEHAFSHVLEKRSDWHKLEGYDPELEKFYNFIRESLAKEIFCGTDIHDTQQKIRLIGLGCGDGQDLQKFRKIYNGRVIETQGVDISTKAIALAKDRFKEDKYVTLVQGNAYDFMKQLSRQKSASNVTIGLACGFLTRQTVTGTREALPILQEAWRKLDILGITGLTVPQVTTTLAASIGWNVYYNQLKCPTRNEIYILNKPNALDANHRFYSEGDFLDLSLTADPISFLKTLNDKVRNSIKRIDLSFAYLLKEEMKALAHELEKLPKLQIIFHDPEDNVQDLKAMLIKFKFFELNRRGNFPDHLPPYTYACDLYITNNWDKLPALTKPTVLTKPVSVSECKTTHFATNVTKIALQKYAEGVKLHTGAKFDLAIVKFEESLQLFLTIKGAELSVANANLALGTAQQKLGNTKEARACFEKSVAIYESINSTEALQKLEKTRAKIKALPEDKVLGLL